MTTAFIITLICAAICGGIHFFMKNKKNRHNDPYADLIPFCAFIFFAIVGIITGITFIVKGLFHMFGG